MDLEQLYAEHGGKVSDKWSIYLSEYSALFQSLRDQPVRLLEIGVQNGGSLEVWRKYFSNAEKIIGCDINPACANLKYDDPEIVVVIGDANTDETERQIIQQSASFDIIIDDGSHQSRDIIRSFARYFAHLNDGGVYIVEDLHCSYIPDFQGGLFHAGSAMTFFKLLTDIVNYEHWNLKISRQDILLGFTKSYDINFAEALLEHIHSITFINSMCVVRKALPQTNLLGSRVIAGCEEAVVPGHLPLNGSKIRHN